MFNLSRAGIRGVIAAAILVVLGGGTAWADDCSVGRTPDGVYPINNADVVMQSEDINIQVESGLVDCNFVFQNTSDASQDVLMGFPARSKIYEEGPDVRDIDVHDFKAYIDGREVPVKLEKEVTLQGSLSSVVGNYESWYVFDVKFPAGAVMNIRNTYRITNSLYAGGDESVGYVLKTGAAWKGKIGHARVVFDLGSIQPYMISEMFPASMVSSGNKVVWERDNIEPYYNLSMMYGKIAYSDEYMSFYSADYKQTLLDKKTFWEVVSQSIASADNDKLEQLYNQALDKKYFVIARYIECNLQRGSDEGPTQIAVAEPDISMDAEDFCTIGVNYLSDGNDLVSGAVQVYHLENSGQVIDYTDAYDLNWLEEYGERTYRFGFDMDPAYKYVISTTVYDSYGNFAQKAWEYDPVSGGLRSVDYDPAAKR